jgi:hypothetical protein
MVPPPQALTRVKPAHPRLATDNHEIIREGLQQRRVDRSSVLRGQTRTPGKEVTLDGGLWRASHCRSCREERQEGNPPDQGRHRVELRGFEPLTSSMPSEPGTSGLARRTLRCVRVGPWRERRERACCHSICHSRLSRTRSCSITHRRGGPSSVSVWPLGPMHLALDEVSQASIGREVPPRKRLIIRRSRAPAAAAVGLTG